MRRSLHLLLALSLLMLSWYQLGHELKAHAGQSSSDCEICLFSGGLGHGATPSTVIVAAPPLLTTPFSLPLYTSPTVTSPFLVAVSERGPPALSFS